MPINQLQVIEKLNLFSWAWRHKLLILFLFFTLPIVISSISLAISEKNFIIPFTQLGESIISSDNLIYKDVQILNTNPETLLGINPTGIYRSFIYYAHISFYIWKMLSHIFMIIIPFTFFYFIFNLINTSTKAKNLILSLILGIGFIFIINLLITIISLANGSLTLTLEGNQFNQILNVIILTIPFHGIISLVGYVISLFI